MLPPLANVSRTRNGRIESNADLFENFASHYSQIVLNNTKKMHDYGQRAAPRRSTRIAEKLMHLEQKPSREKRKRNFRSIVALYDTKAPSEDVHVMGLSALKRKRQSELLRRCLVSNTGLTIPATLDKQNGLDQFMTYDGDVRNVENSSVCQEVISIEDSEDEEITTALHGSMDSEIENTREEISLQSAAEAESLDQDSSLMEVGNCTPMSQQSPLLDEYTMPVDYILDVPRSRLEHQLETKLRSVFEADKESELKFGPELRPEQEAQAPNRLRMISTMPPYNCFLSIDQLMPVTPYKDTNIRIGSFTAYYGINCCVTITGFISFRSPSESLIFETLFLNRFRRHETNVHDQSPAPEESGDRQYTGSSEAAFKQNIDNQSISEEEPEEQETTNVEEQRDQIENHDKFGRPHPITNDIEVSTRAESDFHRNFYEQHDYHIQLPTRPSSNEGGYVYLKTEPDESIIDYIEIEDSSDDDDDESDDQEYTEPAYRYDIKSEVQSEDEYHLSKSLNSICYRIYPDSERPGYRIEINGKMLEGIEAENFWSTIPILLGAQPEETPMQIEEI